MGLKDRLGLKSKQTASRQRLVKKVQPNGPTLTEYQPNDRDAYRGQLDGDGVPRRELGSRVLPAPALQEEDYLYRSAPADLNIAPEQRYGRRAPKASPEIPTSGNPSNVSPRSGVAQVPPDDVKSNIMKGYGFQKNVIDKDTGERRDITEMMHALHYDDEFEEPPHQVQEESPDIDPTRARGEEILVRPSTEIWDRITDFLEPREAANLALTCKTICYLLGSGPFDRLRLPTNKQQRIEFLLPMDIKFPKQLFCFSCANYHTRTHPGLESLQPANVVNPLFDCPNQTNMLVPQAKHRLTEGRTLPFTFVQLVTRAHRFGPEYGLQPESLERRWRDQWSDWSHTSRYHVHKNGHLLVRISSQVFVEGGLTIAAKRMLLYSRSNYTPYFSVCAHWQDGLLMDLCKCALNHIPTPKYRAAALGGPKAPRPGITSLCGDCQPMRRCPRCPTEYLIELKLVEDKSVPMNHHLRFKNAMIVTRWSDLGAGISPQDKEWAAVQGENEEEYDSVAQVGNRSISGTFESAFGDSYPNQRLLNLNPRNTREGAEGNKWY